MEAEIDHGRITVAEPEKLPPTGKALLTVLTTPPKKPDIEVIKSVIGTVRSFPDGAEYERQVRAEWEERERRDWGER